VSRIASRDSVQVRMRPSELCFKPVIYQLRNLAQLCPFHLATRQRDGFCKDMVLLELGSLPRYVALGRRHIMNAESCITTTYGWNAAESPTLPKISTSKNPSIGHNMLFWSHCVLCSVEPVLDQSRAGSRVSSSVHVTLVVTILCQPWRALH
jgi:hypothetical protein